MILVGPFQLRICYDFTEGLLWLDKLSQEFINSLPVLVGLNQEQHSKGNLIHAK